MWTDLPVWVDYTERRKTKRIKENNPIKIH